MVIFPSRCRSFAIVLREASIRVGKYSSSPRTFGCVLAKSSNHHGWQIHSRLAFAPGDVVGKKLISQATGKLVQVCPPDMPVKLAGLNATTQQSQPQCGIELTVEEKTLLTVSFCFRDDRFRQRFFPGKNCTESAGQLSLKPSSLPTTINSRACSLVAASASLKNRKTVRLW